MRALLAVATLSAASVQAARPEYPGTEGGSTVAHFPFCWSTTLGSDESEVCPPQTGCYFWDELTEEVNPTKPGEGQWDAEVPWFNVSGTVYKANPAELKDGVAMRCQCYAFYGVEPSADRTSCVAGDNAALLQVAFIIIILGNFTFAFSYGLTTLVQMVMAGAFQVNPATITLLLCNVAAIFQMALMILYLTTIGGGDADYSLNDGLRGPMLGLFLVGTVASSIEVLIMWIDVLGKSKRMTAKGGGMKRMKTGLHAFNVFLLFFSILTLIAGATTALAGFAAVVLIIVVITFNRGGSKLSKLMMGASNTKSAAAGAIEAVAFRYSAIYTPAFFGLVGYGVLGKKFDVGHAGFLALCVTFFCANFLLNTLTSYVRFGARKKLCKAGYMQENLNIGLGTGGTTMGTTKIAPQPSGTVTTQDLETPRTTGPGAKLSKINPVLMFLNKLWALGFPL